MHAHQGILDLEDPEPGMAPARQDSRRPTIDRQYSTHVYAMTPSQLEAGPQEPQTTDAGRRRASIAMTEAIVTIAPGRCLSARPKLERTDTNVSAASSGVGLEEIKASDEILELVQSQEPGTYRLITDTPDTGPSAEGTDSDLENIRSVELISCNDEMFLTKEGMQDLLTQHAMPKPKHVEWFNQGRHIWFSMYRRLFTILALAQLIGYTFVGKNVGDYIYQRYWYCVADDREYCENHHTFSLVGEISLNKLATIVAGNVLGAIIMRNEHVINFLWKACTILPLSLPLSIRRHFAKIYTYAGMHSAFGICAFAWYILFVVKAIDAFDSEMNIELYSIAVLMGCTIFVLTIVVLMSLPSIRRKFHNEWELSHRIGGWVTVLLVWGQIILLSVSTARQLNRGIGGVLMQLPAFWMLIIITAFLIYPWLWLRRLPVEAEKLSNHAVQLHFKTNKKQSACVGISLSHSPLIENHKFATIPERDGQPGYSVIVSKAGDWTTDLIENPPKYLWTRGRPTIGVMQLSLLFRKIVIVATGSGIGPCLSFLNVYPEWKCRIVWIGRSPALSLGQGVLDSVMAADKDALIVDTLRCPKPDLLALSYAVYKDFEAEAVVIISNPKATDNVVYGLEKRGVPAYGAIFDS